MKIATGWSTARDEKMAVAQAWTQVQEKIGIPDLLWVIATANYDNHVILSEFSQRVRHEKIFGGTSCSGVMTESGFHLDDGRALGILGMTDASGSFGVAAVPLEEARLAGQQGIKLALANADRSGELPALILMTAAPGFEEAIIDGIMDVIGENVPIFGGSSANNGDDGQWQQFSGSKIYQNAVVIAAIYTSQAIGYAFHNGYMPTKHSGIITKAEGRIVFTIDNKPAAEIYNRWTKGSILNVLGKNASILNQSTYFPLGRVVGTMAGIPYYALSHPNQVFADGSLSFFTTLHENDKVTLMTGSKYSLKTRMQRVVRLAKENVTTELNDISGAVIFFCAGCMLVVREEIGEVIAGIQVELPSQPFLAMFSYGEQGCLFGGENRHGNLMLSAIIFGKRNA